MAEQRGAHRIRVRLPARYVSETVRIDAWVENLSRCGILLRSPVVDRLGTEASLEIVIAQQPILRLGAEVVRIDHSVHGPGMGLRFSPLPASVMRSLANYMIEQSYQASA